MKLKQRFFGFLSGHKRGLARVAILASMLLLLYGVIRIFDYTLPMIEHRYSDAARATHGDVTLAYYDLALEHYRQRDYAGAQNLLTAGYTLLSDKDGNIPAGKQPMAADMQLLIGNSLYYQQKLEPAAEAYKQALRHNPNDLNAKYNLELVRQIILSGDGNDPKGAGSGGKGRAKGI
jgi:tetratricopeptide (TPR) repeat protein